MAHFIYEYSANLPEDLLDLQTLMAKMHDTASAEGVFPIEGMRSRAVKCEHFRVGDGSPGNGFLNLSMKVGHGREIKTRLQTGETLFQVLVEHLQPLFDRGGFALSFEMRELDEHVKFNRKNT